MACLGTLGLPGTRCPWAGGLGRGTGARGWGGAAAAALQRDLCSSAALESKDAILTGCLLTLKTVAQIFSKDFFDVDQFKVFVEFVTVLRLFYGLVFLAERHMRSWFPDQELNLRPLHLKEVITIGPPGKPH